MKDQSWTPQPPPFVTHKKTTFQKASLVAEFIYQIGEYEALRKPSEAVPIEEIMSEHIQAQINYVKESLLRYRELTGYGRGVAAIQVGIPLRFSVTFTPEQELLTLINPIITKSAEKKYKYPEICMSANPIIAPVIRPAWIEFEYYDDTGTKQFWNTKDDTIPGRMMNRVFQHEIDHLDGIINIDKASPRELILESDPTFYDTAGFEEVM